MPPRRECAPPDDARPSQVAGSNESLLVALAATMPNPAPASAPAAQPEPADDRYASSTRAQPRLRVTKQLRVQVVEHYRQGLSSLEVAEVLGIAKSTVLRVLKSEGEAVRPWGVRYL